MLIFDWDDTICPTTWAKVNGLNVIKKAERSFSFFYEKNHCKKCETEKLLFGSFDNYFCDFFQFRMDDISHNFRWYLFGEFLPKLFTVKFDNFTIFLLIWIFSNEVCDPFVPEKFIDALSELAELAVKMVRKAASLGKVVIVTNAQVGRERSWVRSRHASTTDSF